MSQFYEGEAVFHELANIFPLMEGQAFADLVHDVKEHGVLEPIVLFDDTILDGRNRYLASKEAGVSCPYVEFAGQDPLAAVISLNLKRRHLSESQRAMVAARVANLSRGSNQHSPIGEPSVSQADAAEMLNVGKRSVERAKEVQSSGSEELIAGVEAGRVSVSAAADVATLPKEEQSVIVAKGEKEILQAAKTIRAAKATKRRAERTGKLIELSNANAPLPEDRSYPIIYADPPWQYDHMISVSREIENQYPTMSIEDICAMDVAKLSTPDAMLFLWVPPSFLHKGVRVIEEWGFNYLTSMVWDKVKMGMGYYARQRHEHLLLAYRGTAIVPDPSSLSPSVISVDRGEHSAKPEEFYSIIERMYPELPRIELFCRTPREGWSAWGNQSDQAA